MRRKTKVKPNNDGEGEEAVEGGEKNVRGKEMTQKISISDK